MSILAFTQQFPTNESCKLHFKLEREIQGIYVKSVRKQNITGYQKNGNGNVKTAPSEQL